MPGRSLYPEGAVGGGGMHTEQGHPEQCQPPSLQHPVRPEEQRHYLTDLLQTALVGSRICRPV